MASGRGSTLFPVQTHDRGPTGSYEGYNQESLPHNSEGQLGMVVEDDNKVYRLVKHEAGVGAVATVDGSVAYWHSRATNEVTADISDSETVVAGGYTGVITDQYYTYIQIGGEDTVQNSAAVAAIGNAYTQGGDGTLTPQAAATEVPVAVGTDLVTPGGGVRWLVGNLL